MKRLVILCGVALYATGLNGGERPVFTVEPTAFSQYVWRGMVVTDGPVLQTSTTAAYRGLHLNVFTNQDLGSVNQRRGNVSELDYDAGYDRSLERVSLSAGVIHYTFPHTGFASTTEVYAGAALAVPLRPSIKVYTDVQAIDGVYATFDVSQGVRLAKPRPNLTWRAEFTAGVGGGSRGYDRGYFGVSRTGVVDFHPAVSAPLAMGARVRIIPRAGYNSVVAPVLRHCQIARAHGFYYGLTLSFTI